MNIFHKGGVAPIVSRRLESSSVIYNTPLTVTAIATINITTPYAIYFDGNYFYLDDSGDKYIINIYNNKIELKDRTTKSVTISGLSPYTNINSWHSNGRNSTNFTINLPTASIRWYDLKTINYEKLNFEIPESGSQALTSVAQINDIPVDTTLAPAPQPTADTPIDTPVDSAPQPSADTLIDSAPVDSAPQPSADVPIDPAPVDPAPADPVTGGKRKTRSKTKRSKLNKTKRV